MMIMMAVNFDAASTNFMIHTSAKTHVHTHTFIFLYMQV